MSLVRTGTRSSRGLRNVLVAFLALALTAVGFIGATPAAQAATSGSYKGRGEGSTKTFKLAGGSMYKFVIRYSGNKHSDWPENFAAYLQGSKTDYPYEFVDEYETSNRITRIVRITGPGKGFFWVDVETDSNASWTVSFKKVSKATRAGRSGTEKGEGSNVSGRYNLTAGVYTVRLSYRDNVDGWGTRPPSAWTCAGTTPGMTRTSFRPIARAARSLATSASPPKACTGSTQPPAGTRPGR